MLPSPTGEALGPACTPRTRAGVGALGLEEVGPAAQSPPCTPALPGPLAVLHPQALGVVRVMSKPFPNVWGAGGAAHGAQTVVSKIGAVTLDLGQARVAGFRCSCSGCLARKLSPPSGHQWVARSWDGQGRPGGLTLPGELAHLPFPCGIVLGALGALPPAPGALVSGGGGAALGRVFVRRPLLGRSLLRGSVFRPFSWRVLLVTLTPESCKMWIIASASGVCNKGEKR